ncbi:Tigger transposable element-derived protein 1, partial [Varanus komodoensis]
VTSQLSTGGSLSRCGYEYSIRSRSGSWSRRASLVRLDLYCNNALVKKKNVEKEGGKKKMIAVEIKKEIIQKHERGMRAVDIAGPYVHDLHNIKEERRGLNAAKGVTKVSKQRPCILEDVEKLLLIWINEKQLAGDTVSENITCEKAKDLHANLVSKLPGTSTENKEGSKASRGWFDNCKRSGIHSVARHRGLQVQMLRQLRAFLEKDAKAEEKAMPGHKPMKDRLTLLFCANASRDFKIKPLLMYHSENA